MDINNAVAEIETAMTENLWTELEWRLIRVASIEIAIVGERDILLKKFFDCKSSSKWHVVDWLKNNEEILKQAKKGSVYVFFHSKKENKKEGPENE